MRLKLLTTLCLALVPHLLWGGTLLTPEQALMKLREGNDRFRAGAAKHPDQTLERRNAVAKTQEPFAAVVACADSRVSPELVFDQGLGSLFVVRTAGAVVDTAELGSLEYAVEHLGVPLLVVAGHERCGAVTATVDHVAAEGSLARLMATIQPATDSVVPSGKAREEMLHQAVEANVWQTVATILRRSAVLKAAVASGKLKLVGASYDMGLGKAEWLGEHPAQSTLLREQAPAEQPQEQGGAWGPKTVLVPGESSEREGATSAAPDYVPAKFIHPALWPWVAGTPLVVLCAGALLYLFYRTALQRWKIALRLGGSIAILLAILVGLGITSLVSIVQSDLAVDHLEEATDEATVMGRVQANFLEMCLAVKDYQLTRNSQHMEDYEKRAQRLHTFLDQAKELLEQAEDQKALEEIRSKISLHERACANLQKVSSLAEAQMLIGEMDALMKLIDGGITGLKVNLIQKADQAGDAGQYAVHTARYEIPAVVLGGLALGVFLAFLLGRSIVLPLRRLAQELGVSSDQTAGASREVSASSQSLAEGASEQAASLEETSASLEEMSSMTKRNAENAHSAKEVVTATCEAAEAGAQSTREMGHAMGRIRQASEELREAMRGIRTAGTDVSKIIKTIDEIAFQTNILALNAAVEAARAGEAGMGFAVVADEVRNLAQRSAKAARETADMIESSIARSEQGVQVSDRVGVAIDEVTAKSTQVEERLREIVSRVQQVDEKTAQIAVASQEQNQGISQVNLAVAQMDKVTQANAASAEETASAAEELSAQATTLREAVASLRVLVGGHAGGAEPSAGHAGGGEEAVMRHAPRVAPLRSPIRSASGSSHSFQHTAAHEIPMPMARGLDLPSEKDFRDF